MSERALLLAFVETEAKATAARAAGADLVVVGSDMEAQGIAAFGADAASRLDELAALGAAGWRAATIDTGPARLLDTVPFADLSAFAQACRDAGLGCGFVGALEAPDVPRLLPLRPAFLGFREAIRTDAGSLDEAAVRDLSALLRTPPAQPALPHPNPDRVFVRDFVQEMEIGAYGSEHGRRQRVRFSIEAELAPAGSPTGLCDIYSYDRMMDAVRSLAARPREAFVETLAEALAQDLLADPRLSAVTVRVEKLDLGPAAAGVEIRRTR